MQPKVSVVMSVYNGSCYLRESVDSILNQTFTDFEFIIIDDGSTDNTWEILTKYAEGDRRIKLYKNEENIGLTKSLNKGLKLAAGEYLARQDADDISLPTRFEKQVSFLQEHPEIVLASCDIELINAEGLTTDRYQRHCEPDLVAWYLLFYNRLGGHSQVMFRRSPVLNIGGYCETYRYSQDYELWCRLTEIGEIAIIPEVLLKQRFHNQRISKVNGAEQENFVFSRIKQNIQKLIGEEISLEEAKVLQGFWLGHWWSRCFPDSHKVGKIHSRIKQIEQKFLQKNIQLNGSHSRLSRQLNIEIGKQFLYWLQAPLSQQQNLLGKLTISFYALNWYPLGVPGSWLQWFKKSLFRKLRTLVRLRHRLISKVNSRSFT